MVATQNAESLPEQPAEDAALVAAMARGRADALGVLYDRYAPTLLALARRIVGRPAAAEDVVHDVFLEAWRRAADYDAARGSVRAWLALRTRSRALDYRKSAAVSRAVYADEGWLEQRAGSSEDGSLAPDRSRLQKALARLSKEQQEVLLLGYFEGLSSSEIAEKTGLPIGTVKSRVAAALAALRRALGEGAEAPV